MGTTPCLGRCLFEGGLINNLQLKSGGLLERGLNRKGINSRTYCLRM